MYDHKKMHMDNNNAFLLLPWEILTRYPPVCFFFDQLQNSPAQNVILAPYALDYKLKFGSWVRTVPN